MPCLRAARAWLPHSGKLSCQELGQGSSHSPPPSWQSYSGALVREQWPCSLDEYRGGCVCGQQAGRGLCVLKNKPDTFLAWVLGLSSWHWS